MALGALGHARRARNAEIVLDLSRRWAEALPARSREKGSNYDSAGLKALIEELYDPPAGRTPAQQRAHVRLVFELLVSLNLIETVGVLRRPLPLSVGGIGG